MTDELRERVKVTQADRVEAERFRRGKGGKYDRDVMHLALAFSHVRHAAISTVMQDLEAPSEALVMKARLAWRDAVEASTEAPHIEVPMTAAIKAVASHVKDQTP